MAVEAETRQDIIELVVTALDAAPGTSMLNKLIEIYEEEGTLVAVAEAIVTSDHFTTMYPGFLTPGEFAEQWLGRLIPEAPMAVMTEVQELVVRLINSGTTAPQAVIAAATYLSAGVGPDEFESTFENFANKVEVATLHTVTGRMDGDFEALQAVLAEVTSDEATVQPARDGFPEPMGPDPMTTSQTFTLTTGIDSGPEFTGGDADDTFIAAPVQGADLNSVDTLNADDELDGGGGTDTIRIRGAGDLTIEDALVSNIEIAQIRASGSIDADLSGWDGLQSVEIARIGSADDLEVTVDGAMVKVGDTLGGDVTIVGAGGMVDIKAGKDSDVVIGSGDHTESAMVKGGASVTVAKNGAGAQSMTVTKVVVDGVAEGQVTVITPAIPADTSGVTEVRPGSIGDISTSGSPSANNPRYQLWDPDGNANTRTSIQPEDKAAHAAGDKLYWFVATTNAEQIEVTGNALDNYILITDNIENARGYVPGTAAVTTPAGPTVRVHSDAIETVQLHNTKTMAVIKDESKTEDGKKGAPEPLTVAVDDFDGELHLQGVGASNDVTFNVVKDSSFKLAANAVKTINVEGDGKLTLDVDKLPTEADPMKASDTLESLVLSGAGKFTMDADGLSKLKMVDASEAGDVMLTKVGASLEMYTGGDGADHLHVSGHNAKNGLQANLGAGNDSFSSDAGNSKSRIDGGGGRDTLELTSAKGGTHGTGAAAKSIYSNFEVLDVGGSETGTYDVKMLGVEDITVSKSTKAGATVTLKNMGSLQDLSIGTTGNAATSATIVHQLGDRESGTSRNDRSDLVVELNGGKDPVGTGKGKAAESVALTLTTDDEIRDLVVGSYTTGTTTGPANRQTAVDNTLTLGDDSEVQEIIVDGNAKLTITAGDGLSELSYFDASDNTRGVVIDASASGEEIEMFGSSGDDEITGSPADDILMGGSGDDMLDGGSGGAGGADTLMGGAGADVLTGGDGDDDFGFYGDSSSYVTFKDDGTPQGHDTIMDFNDAGADEIYLGDDLNIVGRVSFLSADGTSNVGAQGITTVINRFDAAAANTPDSLQAFLRLNGNGLFERRDNSNQVVRDTIVVVDENGRDVITEDLTASPPVIGMPLIEANRWVLIDIDGDGDWDSGDMAIRLVGTDATTVPTVSTDLNTGTPDFIGADLPNL